MHDPHLAKVREFLSNDPEPDQSEWNDIIIEAERFRTELMDRGCIQDANVPEDTPVETYAAPNLEEVLPLMNELIAGLKTKDVSSARNYADEVYQKTKELFL